MNRAYTPGLKALIEIARASGRSYASIERRAGVGPGQIARWQLGRYGSNLTSAESVAEALGYELQWVPKEKAPDGR